MYEIKDKWLEDLNEDLQGSDRSCAVLAGAILDDLLKSLLQRYLLRPKNKKDDRLLGRSGFIDSFSARIELACRLNLISENMRKALNWIRGIRNDAAHETDFTFVSDSNKDRVSNIISVLKIDKKAESLLRRPYEGVKGNFVVATILMASCLKVEIGETRTTKFELIDPMANLKITDQS